MIVQGFVLTKKSDRSQAARWAQVPPCVELMDGATCLLRVDAAQAGWENESYSITATSWEEPDPAPVRRLIEKSLVLSRLTDAQLDAALGAMTNRQKERWRMPGAPSIYVDDPELLGLLNFIGADPAVILA